MPSGRLVTGLLECNGIRALDWEGDIPSRQEMKTGEPAPKKKEEPKKEEPKKEEGAVDVNDGQSIKDRAKMFEKKDDGLGGPGI